jgi:hypothetical protein
MKILKQNRMKQLIIALVFLSTNLFAQNKKEITVGYFERYDKLPKLKFAPSSLAAYDKCQPAKQLISIKLKASKTHHIIQTKGKQFNLKKYKDYGGEEGHSGYDFLGYYPKLKLFAVIENATAEHLGFGNLVLIDSLTSRQYAINSIGDGAVETPIPSPKGNYLIYFYNWPYEDNSCFIGLLKVNDRKNPVKMLVEKASFDTKHWAVENIKWMDDRTFLVKAFTVKPYKRNDERVYQYLKAKIQ